MGHADLVGPATDQFSLGVVLYQMLVDRRPFDAPALRGLSRVKARIEEAISREPKSATYRVERTSIRRAAGDERGAREDVDKAIAIEPRNVAALTARGTIRAEGGEFKGAMADIDAVLEVDPTNAVAREVRGQVLLAPDRAKEAEADFTVAIAARPGRAELLVGRGLARQRLGNLDGAIADEEAAVSAATKDDAWSPDAHRALVRRSGGGPRRGVPAPRGVGGVGAGEARGPRGGEGARADEGRPEVEGDGPLRTPKTPSRWGRVDGAEFES